MQKKLLIFSHCYIYGGSERLMKSIYDNSFILEKYKTFFSYHLFKDYEKGLLSDNHGKLDNQIFIPLNTLDNSNFFYKIDLAVKSKLLRYVIKLPFFCLKKVGLYAIWNFIIFYFLLRRVNPDAVHINNGGYPAASGCNQLALVLRFFPSIKIVYQVNNITFKTHSNWQKWKDALIYNQVNTFLTHSKQAAAALVNRGFPKEKISTIPSFFEETLNFDINIKKEFHILPTKTLLISVGLLTYRKGHLFLLKALEKIKNDFPNVYKDIKLIIIGDGEEKSNLLTYIDGHQLNDNVTLAGYRKDSHQFINEADIFVLPSVQNEDLPLVLLTAMQYNKCIVASNFAGIADLLTHEHDALLVQPNIETIVDDLSKQILRLLGNKGFANQLSSTIKTTYKEKIGQEKYASELLKFYSEK
jgi:glycosyltransferase involved in cell wall biosynthesis